jgi:hypothetical protein
VHPALGRGRIVAVAWAGRGADQLGGHYRELFPEWARDFLWASVDPTVAAVVPAQWDAEVDREPRGEQPVADGWIAADALRAVRRRKPGARSLVVRLAQQVVAVAVEAARPQREPQSEKLAQQVLPRLEQSVRPATEQQLAWQPALQRELAARPQEEQLREPVSDQQAEQIQAHLPAPESRASRQAQQVASLLLATEVPEAPEREP